MKRRRGKANVPESRTRRKAIQTDHGKGSGKKAGTKEGAKAPSSESVAIGPKTHPNRVDLLKALKSHMAEAEDCLMQGRFDEAVKHADTVVQLMPTSVDVYGFRAIIYARIGRLAEAEADFSKAVELDPNNPYVWSDWAICLKVFGRYKEAEAKFRKAMEVGPSNLIPRFSYGLLLNELGRWEEAERVLTEAIELMGKDPVDTMILAHSAKAEHIMVNLLLARTESRLRTRRYNEGWADLKAALALVPDHPQALALLKVLRSGWDGSEMSGQGGPGM